MMTKEPTEGSQKAVVSVSEMARLVGLSRARFYQLIGTTFPEPIRLEGNRPAYDERLQEVCLRVRQQNMGIDGKTILFYSKRTSAPKPSKAQRRSTRHQRKAKQPRHGDLIEILGQLGLEATDSDVARALAACFPDGSDGVQEGEIISTVFRHLKRSTCQNRTDNVRR